MRADLLLALADHMETVSDEAYDQRHFCISDRAIDVAHWGRLGGFAVAPEGFCGSSACILGHAPSVPAIREAGLIIIAFGSTPTLGGMHARAFAVVSIDVDTGDLRTSIEAAARTFDIPQDHAAVIFGEPANPRTTALFTGEPGADFEVTPVEAAAVLRRYVETAGETVKSAIALGDAWVIANDC